MTVAVAILCALAVLSALIGAVAFLRLATPLEKLHPGTFVAVASGVPIAVAAFLTEGVSGQTLKIVAIVVVFVVTGALANHAVARAIFLRSGSRR